MNDVIVAVRVSQGGPLLWCYAAARAWRAGERVRVALDGGLIEAVVAIAPDDILAAPPLGTAPRIVDVLPTEEHGDVQPVAPDGVAFLPADDAPIGLGDLAQALRLAALPVPEPPPGRR